MSRWRIRPGRPLRGRVRVAGDLQIGQQALVWAALAEGRSSLTGLAPRSDHALLCDALRALGVRVEQAADALQIEGVGLRGLRMPPGALNAGDSETALALLTALLAGQRFGTRVEAQGAARSLGLRTLIVPLRERGAHVGGASADDELTAPVAVAPLFVDELLASVEIEIPAGDARTKLGLLLSGLYARGVTAIRESMLSRDHVERALVALGLPVDTAAGMTLLDTSEATPAWAGFSWHVPGDFTLASYLLAAGLIVPGSDLTVEDVGLNPTRTAWLDALRGSGARAAVAPKGDAAGNEPRGDVRVQASRIARVRVGGERAFGLLDEVPALAALALASADRISIRDVGSLRTRRPDALNALRDLLGQFQIDCTGYHDGLEVDPPARVRGARIGASVAPALGLLACVLGLVAEGETVIEGAEQLEARYPGVLAALQSLGADIACEEGS